MPRSNHGGGGARAEAFELTRAVNAGSGFSCTVHANSARDDAATLLDKAIVGWLGDDVPEIRSLGGTLARWRTEILNHHPTGASNGPTEALNLGIKKVKRAGHGFRRFDHYRLRCLLHAGGVNWPNRPKPPRIRTRRFLLR